MLAVLTVQGWSCTATPCLSRPRAPEEEDPCLHNLSHLLAHCDCMLVSAAVFSISMVNALNLPLSLTSISLLALELYFASALCQHLISGVTLPCTYLITTPLSETSSGVLQARTRGPPQVFYDSALELFPRLGTVL